ncbi:NUDIX domain-containing protein [Lactococcus termiticola]|uniref:Dihydroneopterin triphosphate pyrophosphatase n=1 Tax=Lactococcus termiticola TaxID=2169526 RepID=A0A2R5HKH3_9LACT|nr:NUDIX domain-containing protein [Lactococcus termiticola]GBG97061.1 dihydroneopterin triphosphate pyrophosphatase [Lactococcus termiticola]
MNFDLLEEIQDFRGSKFDEIRELMASETDLRGKQNPRVQLSASALVFSGERLYFIEHPYQKDWLLPAGHVELDEQPLETAIREFHEETGLFAKAGLLVDLNIIKIPENVIKHEPAHRHIDFRYLLELVEDKPAEEAELKVKLMTRAEAPEEFKPYFDLER